MKSEQSFHEDFARHDEVAAPSDRRFGVAGAGVFALVGCLPRLTGRPLRMWPFAVSAVFALAALVAPSFLGPVHRLLAAFGRLAHRVVSPVALGLVFFAVITPMGVLMRALGYDPLHRRFDPQLDNYWIKRPLGGPAPETMRHQF